MRARDRALKRDDAFGADVGVRQTRESQNGRDVSFVLVSKCVRLWRGMEPCIVRQSRSALHNMRDVVGCFVETLVDPNAEDALGLRVRSVIQIERAAKVSG